jgi:hypothetical protein
MDGHRDSVASMQAASAQYAMRHPPSAHRVQHFVALAVDAVPEGFVQRFEAAQHHLDRAPEWGRIAAVSPLSLTSWRRVRPQCSRIARWMPGLCETTAMTPPGWANCVSMLRLASTSRSRPQLVMELCSAAGMLKPARSAPHMARAAISAHTLSVPRKLTR